ncbi:MAG TPA: murein L,D-transpeptidase catalytic domain family protein [Thermoanaerobaculia bacterium]
MKRVLFAAALLCALDVHAACGPAPSHSLVSSLLRQAPGLHAEALKLAMDSTRCATEQGLVKRRSLLTVIDYSIRSSEPRLFVFDLAAGKLLFRELCAHGKSSGGDITNYFSNEPGSEASSLGLFVTGDTYFGHNGYSLRLRGLEEGVNDMASERAIVLHGAYYVSREAVRVLGRLGRSWGCPAVRSEIAEKLINTIRGGSAIFAYYPQKTWLARSAFLRADAAQAR